MDNTSNAVPPSDLDGATEVGDPAAYAANPGEFAARWNMSTPERRQQWMDSISAIDIRHSRMALAFVAVDELRKRWSRQAQREMPLDNGLVPPAQAISSSQAARLLSRALQTLDPADKTPEAHVSPDRILDPTPIGWIIVDKTTREIDWDGKMHLTLARAQESLVMPGEDAETTSARFDDYDILPVLGVGAAPAAVVLATASESGQVLGRERKVLEQFLSGQVVPSHTDFESALWGACTAMMMLRDRAPRLDLDSRLWPHSRACGIRAHKHGSACHTNCPTCAGGAL